MNRLIEILVMNQRERVQLSWTHLARFCPTTNGCLGNQGTMGAVGCYGSQGYNGDQGSIGVQGYFGAQGSYGRTGPISVQKKQGKTYIVRPVPRTEMPETLEFTIRFADAKELYEEFLLLLCRISPHVHDNVRITSTPPKPIPRQQRLKEEFIPVLQKKKEEFEKRKAKIYLLIEMAEELGLQLEDGFDVDRRDAFTMSPDAYEEFGQPRETDGEIKIMCRSKTEIYKALDRAGLLQLYCPQEYRRGDSYSVNGGPMNSQPTEEVIVEDGKTE